MESFLTGQEATYSSYIPHTWLLLRCLNFAYYPLLDCPSIVASLTPSLIVGDVSVDNGELEVTENSEKEPSGLHIQRCKLPSASVCRCNTQSMM